MNLLISPGHYDAFVSCGVQVFLCTFMKIHISWRGWVHHAVLDVFRRVRDEIRERILAWLREQGIEPAV